MEGCVAPDALARVLLGEADVPAWAAREGARVAVVDVRGNMTRKIVGARQVAAHEFLRSVDAYVAELSGVDAVVCGAVPPTPVVLDKLTACRVRRQCPLFCLF
eukprot:TRINITY_DN2362_c0_g1_i2.p1 TRINITY_DN2362_c0_g1~~TRINITY_DN2362_c0_g1_i2.p1  ORF type:complete len:103 (-),score=17.56 TRINITY_DN2362_c0_g1_i2:400-708(-)